MVFGNIYKYWCHGRVECGRGKWYQSDEHLCHPKCGSIHFQSQHGDSHGTFTGDDIDSLRIYNHRRRGCLVCKMRSLDDFSDTDHL